MMKKIILGILVITGISFGAGVATFNNKVEAKSKTNETQKMNGYDIIGTLPSTDPQTYRVLSSQINSKGNQTFILEYEKDVDDAVLYHLEKKQGRYYVTLLNLRQPSRIEP